MCVTCVCFSAQVPVGELGLSAGSAEMGVLVPRLSVPSSDREYERHTLLDTHSVSTSVTHTLLNTRLCEYEPSSVTHTLKHTAFCFCLPAEP